MPHLLHHRPANLETSIGCGRRRAVAVRTPEGPRCPTCRPATTLTCSICDRSAPAGISKSTSKPWCHACSQRRARCPGCGDVRGVHGGTLTDPLCATCTRPDPSSWRTCPGCGEHTIHRNRRCACCSLRQRLSELLSDDTGQVQPRLQALHENLANHERPKTVLAWLNKDTASATLRELAAGQGALTHAALDAVPDSKPIRHLRAVLVATGALAPRDEHLIRLEHWVATSISGHREQQLLHRYAVWHLLRRLRARNNGHHATHGQATAVQQHVRAAIALLDWLTARRLELVSAGLGDLDTWLSSQPVGRREAGHFVPWANATS